MKNRIIAIDQSTSATKALLFNDNCELLHRVNIEHKQYYPQIGWVEHDANEIYANTINAIKQLIKTQPEPKEIYTYSLAITNQRETALIWSKKTGQPIYNAIVWQCLRGTEICKELRQEGYGALFQEKTGLLIDPYFSASGIKWILDNVPKVKDLAEKGDLLMGTIDSWLIWKLTGGKIHATDYTNASRTLLFNINTLDWDNELLDIFGIPRSMMPLPLACDSFFGETTLEGLFEDPILIAGVIGDSHGALTGQMCFEEGMGKATYGTGSSVMVNVGENVVSPPQGLVTSIGFSALGKTFYAFEGNIHCTGATIKWLIEKLNLVDSLNQVEVLAESVKDTEGVYLVPAFAGLGAPWWKPDAKASISGMTLSTEKAHVVRAALESIAYQVKDLVDIMTNQAKTSLKELRVDGGPTKNKFLMQFQSDMLRAPIRCSSIEEASALGAVIMNGFARGLWKSFDKAASNYIVNNPILPQMDEELVGKLYEGWKNTVQNIIR